VRRSSLIVVLLSALPTGTEAAESWTEVRSPNFTLVSNAGERRARGTAWELEQARAAFAKLWPWAKLAPGRPTVVIAAKDEGTLKRWAPRYWEVKGGIRPVSLGASGADREYLLLRLDGAPTDGLQVTGYFTLYRAYVSKLLSSSLERPLPVWLSIGLGEVYGNTSVLDKEVQVGKAVPWHLRKLNQRTRHPLPVILAAQRDTPLVSRDDERDMFDAQCWALVHYLTFGDKGAHAPGLDRFIRLWLAGRPQDVAWAESLPDVRTLQDELPVYTSGVTIPYGRLLADVNLERERLPVRPLAPAETAALQAGVHVALRRPAEARAAIEGARTADPTSAASYDAEGLLADHEGDKARAAQAYGKAEELRSTSSYTHYRAAQLAWKQPADPETLAAIRKRLERAIELNDLYAYAYSYLAEVMAYQDEAKAALPLAQRALTLDPGDAYNHVALARVLYRLGDAPAARSAAQRGLTLADRDRDRANAEDFLRFMDEDAAYRRRQESQQATGSQLAACQGGDSTACTEVIPVLERTCGEGQSGACAFAGWLFAEGRGVAKDAPRAASFWQRACAAGDKHACVQHALGQARGEGVPQDVDQAMTTLDGLCREEFFAGCTQLALLYAGRPGAKDRARARELLAKACEGGEPDACGLAKSMPRD